MKKYILLFVLITAALCKIQAQSGIPAIDSREYEGMKQRGLLTPGGIRPHPSPEELRRLGGSTHTRSRRSTGCGTFVPGGVLALGPVDDGSRDSVIHLPFSFCFYGTNYDSCYINNNGNISFLTTYGTFSSSSFPDPSYVMVAPFWADVDTRGPSGDGTGAGTVIYTLTPTYLMVTWDHVGYFPDMIDKLNTFQLIITDGMDPILPVGNNIAFNYGDMQWTTGSASSGVGGFGGTPATVGINKGDGINYIQLGRFDAAGAAYDGGYGLNDGVDWLDQQSFYFNACSSTNIAPIASGFSNCDTLKLCALADTLILNGLFLSPESGQTTSVTVNLGGTPGATVLSTTTGNTASATVEIIASVANAGNNVITFTGTDDGTPTGVTVINVNVFVDTTGLYAFNPVLSGSFSFCAGDSTLISVSPTTYDSYLWSTGSTDSAAYVHDTGSHWVTSMLNGCSKSNLFYTSLAPPADATITPVPYQCVSDAPITLTAATTGGTWSGFGIIDATNGIFSPDSAGVGDHIITYTLTIPCLSVDTVSIHVVRQLIATITNVGPFCTTSPAITLNAVDTGGVWTGTGITNARTGAFDPAIAGPGSHIITYRISALCGAVDTSTIVVAATPIISFTADTTEGCEPTAIVFTSVVDQPDGSSLWNFGDGNTSTTRNPTNIYETANIYTVTFTYTNTTGCSATVTQNNMITIHSQPVAIYSADPQPTTIVNPTIHFTDHSTGVINDWKWSFGTTDTSILQSPTYTYVDTGAFPIQLIITNNYGCTDTAVGSVVINQILLLYAPNAFTPDGNGINDEFTVKGEDINLTTFEMRIFNRWGELIYRTDDIAKGWNGGMNNNGGPLKQDEYVWKVDFLDYSNLKHSYIGHVMLLGNKN